MTLKIKDPGSALTHFIAMILALCAASPLIIKAAAEPDKSHVLALSIFIVSMILLYAASTIYHTLDISPKINRMLRKVDHMMIFILIAGTYTPVCMLVLGDRTGWIMLALVWGIAAAGILINAFVDHLSQVVFLHGLHCHGLGLRTCLRKDHRGTSAAGLWLASGRRYHLYRRPA